MKDNKYKCAMCGGVFLKGQTDEEARTEMADDFPHHAEEDMELVCDDCYKRCCPENNPEIYRDYKTQHPEYYGAKFYDDATTALRERVDTLEGARDER